MNSSRKESERTKFVQEKCQTLLTLMLRDEDNKYCVDCDAKGPRWASWNLGVFLCIRCAGIHRNLGVHISRVKSVNLDSWTPEQVVSLQQMGNSRARAVYEAQMPDGFRRPQTDSALESFIRAKYEQKKYVAREWVQPPPVKVNWDKEIDEEMEKLKRKKKGLSTTSTSSKPIETPKSSASFKSTPLPAPLPKPTGNSSSPKTSSRLSSSHTTNTNVEIKTSEVKSYSSDLLGLSTPSNGASASDAKTLISDSSNDVFGVFLSDTSSANGAANGKVSAKPSITTTNQQKEMPELSLAQQEQDFFNQVPNEKEKAKMTKDSILALYGAAPTINRLPTNTNNQYIPQGMPGMDNGTAFGIPFQQSNVFGMANAGMNNFQQLGMMQQVQTQPSMNFQQVHTMNTATNQSIGHGIGNLTQSNPPLQPFTQQMNQNPNSNVNNVNQQFGGLNLGNVWQ